MMVPFARPRNPDTRQHSHPRPQATGTRRALSALVIAALGVAAGGYGSSPSFARSVGSSGKLASIFFANPLPAYPDWGTADKCFYAETKKLGINGVSQGPTGLQVNDQFVIDRITQAIAQKYGAIMMVPIAPSEYEPLIKRARSLGIEVATLNTGTATKSQNFEVGTDYPHLGSQIARNIGNRGGTQRLGLISNAPGGIGDVILGALKAHLPPNVHVVATAYDGADPAKTTDVTEQMLIAHPDINIIYSWEGTAVAGITTAIKERNAVHKVVAVVNDLTPQVIDGIHAGTIYGTNWQHFCAMAKVAVDKLVAVSQGKSVPATIDTGTTFVTAANLDRVLKQAQAGS